MKVSVVNSAGGSFCWNYATDTFYGNYAGVCCIYAGFEMVIFGTVMLVDLSVAIKQVTVSVAIMQLEVSGAHMQMTLSAAKISLVDNFCCNYVDGSFCCNYAGSIFCSALCT